MDVIKGVSLRGIEIFEALAHSGSVAGAAARTSLSQSAVSQQIRNLEGAIGAELIDHSRRPMRLTPAGALFLTRAEAALAALRLAQSELQVMDLAQLTALHIGIIDDFDDNLTPRLATILGDNLEGCRLKLITASSHDLMSAMSDRSLHLAISARTGSAPEGVIEHPLARDPFILVTPTGPAASTATDVSANLPFLRYDRGQLIRAQIDAHLSQHQISYPERFEIGSHLALMAMVARGLGWSITTPLGFMRAHRFHNNLQAHPLPIPAFSRQISLFASSDWSHAVPRDVAATMRRLIKSQMIDPALAKLPFLEGALSILEGDATNV
ncbi:MAG: LysR family transcriptional regulator [Pseudomonadota bacterium]